MTTDNKTLAGALTRFRCAGYDPTDGSGPIMVADPDGPWVLATDVIGTSSDCEATPASPDSPESGGDWFGDVLGSIGTVIPLADVQPGGRVRLGDSLPPLPCTHYNACGDGSEPLYTSEQMRDYALSAQPSPGGQDAPERCCECRHTTFEVHPDGHICVHCKLIVAAQPSPGETLPPEMRLGSPDYLDYLDTRPSPGGQGDAVRCGKCKDRGYVDVDVDVDDSGSSIGNVEACPHCALAARQPVRSSTVSDDMMDVVDRLGSEHDEVDPRAWDHMLIYAPTDKLYARLAARQPVGEPIGWYTDDHLTDRSATTYDRTVAERWRAKGWPVSPLYAAPPAQAVDLAPDHRGMRVSCSGLLSQVRGGLKSNPELAEMVRQLHGHLNELGKRWYAGDRKVVDEFLQLYVIEDGARRALIDSQAVGNGR